MCTPTRYALLTGRHAWRVLEPGVLSGRSPLVLDPSRPTIASVLADAGYITQGIGKWHLGLGSPEETDYAEPLSPGPRELGFDDYFGTPASPDMEPYMFFRNEHAVEPLTEEIEASDMRRHGGDGFWRGGKISPSFRHEDVQPRFIKEALSFLDGRSSSDEPFFLYLALAAPHTPWLPTESFRGQSRAGHYGDFVHQVDSDLGRLLDKLDERGLTEKTLLMATSDNGAHWLQTDIEEFGHRANGRWRGQKADIHEGGHRVPFLVRWPGRIKAGTERTGLLGLVDVMATVASAAGVELPGDAAPDCRDQLRVLLGERPGVRDSLVHHSSLGLFALRSGSYKLIEGLGSGGFTAPQSLDPTPGGPKGQLYDLAHDPAESTNLWLERPDDVARLLAELDRIRATGN